MSENNENELVDGTAPFSLTYSTFNRHAATALVCLTAELGVYDCVFGRVSRGVLKSILWTVAYILLETGVLGVNIPLIVFSLLLMLAVEIIATVACFQISCSDRSFVDWRGRFVRGHKWGLSLAIPRAIFCVFLAIFLLTICFVH